MSAPGIGERSTETSSRLGAALYLVELREARSASRGSSHSSKLAARLREGTFMSAGHRIYIQDADTLRDAADLYAVLGETVDTGSPNLENTLAKSFVEILQTGGRLNDEQLGKLLDMLKRHAGELRAYRASSDPSRNIFDVPHPGTAKILS